MAFSPDGTKVLTAGEDNSLRIWDIQKRQEVKTLENPRMPYYIRFSNEGSKVLIVIEDPFTPEGHEADTCTALIWSPRSARAPVPLQELQGKIEAADFSPDGSRLITIGKQTREITQWNANTGKTLNVLRGHEDDVYDARYSPDGRTIASGSKDTSVHIWDSETGRELYRLQGHRDAVTAVVFSADNSKLVTASWDKTSRLYVLQFAELREMARKRLPIFSQSTSPK